METKRYTIIHKKLENYTESVAFNNIKEIAYCIDSEIEFKEKKDFMQLINEMLYDYYVMKNLNWKHRLAFQIFTQIIKINKLVINELAKGNSCKEKNQWMLEDIEIIEKQIEEIKTKIKNFNE